MTGRYGTNFGRGCVATAFVAAVAAGCSSGGGSSSASPAKAGPAVTAASESSSSSMTPASKTPPGVPANASLVSTGKFGHVTVVNPVPANAAGTAYVFDVTANKLAGKYAGYTSAGGGTYSGDPIDVTHELQTYFLPAGTKPKFAR